MNKRQLLRDFLIVNIAAGLAGTLMFGVMQLQRRGILPVYPCAVHALLHVYCPGCGGTRALYAALRGNIIASLGYNPAIVLGGLLAAIYEVGVILTLLGKKGRYYYYRKPQLVYGFLIFMLIYTVVRDLLLVGGGIDLLGDFIQ